MGLKKSIITNLEELDFNEISMLFKLPFTHVFK